MTATTTEPETRAHEARMAAVICETSWESVLERLPARDGYLPGQLTAAAVRLRETDTAAAEAIDHCRAAQDRYGAPLEAQTQQLQAAEQAVADRHEARCALADLLFLARTVIEDA